MRQGFAHWNAEEVNLALGEKCAVYFYAPNSRRVVKAVHHMSVGADRDGHLPLVGPKAGHSATGFMFQRKYSSLVIFAYRIESKVQLLVVIDRDGSGDLGIKRFKLRQVPLVAFAIETKRGETIFWSFRAVKLVGRCREMLSIRNEELVKRRHYAVVVVAI